jgi:hypothetical protein
MNADTNGYQNSNSLPSASLPLSAKIGMKLVLNVYPIGVYRRSSASPF